MKDRSRSLLAQVLLTETAYASHMMECALCRHSRMSECPSGSELLAQNVIAVLNAQVYLDNDAGMGDTDVSDAG